MNHLVIPQDGSWTDKLKAGTIVLARFDNNGRQRLRPVMLLEEIGSQSEVPCLLITTTRYRRSGLTLDIDNPSLPAKGILHCERTYFLSPHRIERPLVRPDADLLEKALRLQ